MSQGTLQSCEVESVTLAEPRCCAPLDFTDAPFQSPSTRVNKLGLQNTFQSELQEALVGLVFKGPAPGCRMKTNM